MSLKLVFNNEIHRVSKLPGSITALVQTANTLFSSTLPSQWGFQYVDSEGDKVVLKSEEDFQAMLAEVSQSKKSVKIYITSDGKFDQIEDSQSDFQIIPSETRPSTGTSDVLKTNRDNEEGSGWKKDKWSKFKDSPKFKVLRLHKLIQDEDTPGEQKVALVKELESQRAKLTEEELEWVDRKLAKRKMLEENPGFQRGFFGHGFGHGHRHGHGHGHFNHFGRHGNFTPSPFGQHGHFGSFGPFGHHGQFNPYGHGHHGGFSQFGHHGFGPWGYHGRHFSQMGEERGEMFSKEHMRKWKAIMIFKKLNDSETPTEKKEWLEKKLAKIVGKMDEETRAKFEAKKEKILQRGGSTSRERSGKKCKFGQRFPGFGFFKHFGGMGGHSKWGEHHKDMKKLNKEFCNTFSALPQEKQAEVSSLLNGVPEKMIALRKAKKEMREQRRKEFGQDTDGEKSERKCGKWGKCGGKWGKCGRDKSEKKEKSVEKKEKSTDKKEKSPEQK